MKYTAILVALAAAVAAPLAAAQTNCATASNVGVLGNLTVSSSTKRMSVTGGHRIVQTITVKNGASSTASGLKLTTPYQGSDNTYLKGYGRIPGTGKITLSKDSGALTVSSGSTAFSIPAGKTLKATLTWRSVRCTTADFNFGPPTINIPADTNAACSKTYGTATTVCLIVFKKIHPMSVENNLQLQNITLHKHCHILPAHLQFYGNTQIYR